MCALSQDYKTFFMLSSADHEILPINSKLLINTAMLIFCSVLLHVGVKISMLMNMKMQQSLAFSYLSAEKI